MLLSMPILRISKARKEFRLCVGTGSILLCESSWRLHLVGVNAALYRVYYGERKQTRFVRAGFLSLLFFVYSSINALTAWKSRRYLLVFFM